MRNIPINTAITKKAALSLAILVSFCLMFAVSCGSKSTPIPTTTPTLTPTPTFTEYWDVQYAVADGSTIVFNYSLDGLTAYHRIANLSNASSRVTIRISKTVVDGTRDIRLLSAGWHLPSIYVKDVSPDVDMDVAISLTADATGKLYVQDGVGDVDMSSISSRTTKPKQINTYGDGTKDPAGSMLVNLVLQGYAKTTVGKDVPLPFWLVFTTGNIINTVSIPSTKFNGATLSSQGTPFAQTGPFTASDNLPDYVGTPGTITTTGTSDCLGLILVGVNIDFQTEIRLVLEPVSVTSGHQF